MHERQQRGGLIRVQVLNRADSARKRHTRNFTLDQLFASSPREYGAKDGEGEPHGVRSKALSELIDIIEAEEELDRDQTIKRLARSGYSRAPVCEDPGTYAVRGGVLDVFVPLYRFPVRIEFYGDLVESLRFYDPATQRTLRKTTEIYLHPELAPAPPPPPVEASGRSRESAPQSQPVKESAARRRAARSRGRRFTFLQR